MVPTSLSNTALNKQQLRLEILEIILNINNKINAYRIKSDSL